jgi:hypothetical protein
LRSFREGMPWDAGTVTTPGTWWIIPRTDDMCL